MKREREGERVTESEIVRERQDGIILLQPFNTFINMPIP